MVTWWARGCVFLGVVKSVKLGCGEAGALPDKVHDNQSTTDCHRSFSYEGQDN